jgi:hypothetical protein
MPSEPRVLSPPTCCCARSILQQPLETRYQALDAEAGKRFTTRSNYVMSMGNRGWSALQEAVNRLGKASSIIHLSAHFWLTFATGHRPAPATKERCRPRAVRVCVAAPVRCCAEPRAEPWTRLGSQLPKNPLSGEERQRIVDASLPVTYQRCVHGA